ncbi:MAG: DoxX [Daejeonella sp.]|nr:DoxX [Daejeonella sp.]
MDIIFKSGKYLYATALIAFSALQFITGNFVVGRAPGWEWATTVTPAWAYLTGIILLVAGAAIISNKNAAGAAGIVGLLILLAPVVRFIPVVIADNSFGGDWTNFFKSLALAGGSFIIASSLKDKSQPHNSSIFAGLINTLIPIGRFLIAAFFLVGGIQHFIFADFVKFLVPVWIPAPLFWTYFAGISLIAAGLGLVISKTVRVASLLSGLMIFIWMLILHLPRAIASPLDVNEWLGCFETMAFSGILFVLAREWGIGSLASENLPVSLEIN